MNTIYQHTRADDDKDWSDGQASYARESEVVYDFARFHRGAGFTLKERGKPESAPRKLRVAMDNLGNRLEDSKPGTVFELQSLADPGWKMLVRRLVVETDGEKVVQWFENRLGLPYVLGGNDCSGTTMKAHGTLGIELPHKAEWQHDLFRGGRPGFFHITRAQVKRGDMIFTNHDDHVCVYYGPYRGVECCIDTEPSDTVAPWGGMLGTGIRVRPMTGNYYNAWERVNGVGRIVAVNGIVT